MPINLPLGDYVNPWTLIHPVWLRDYLEEQRVLYSDRPSAKEAFEEWNKNREYFYSVFSGA